MLCLDRSVPGTASFSQEYRHLVMVQAKKYFSFLSLCCIKFHIPPTIPRELSNRISGFSDIGGVLPFSTGTSINFTMTLMSVFTNRREAVTLPGTICTYLYL
jgi:hypothetical protein